MQPWWGKAVIAAKQARQQLAVAEHNARIEQQVGRDNQQQGKQFQTKGHWKKFA
jgi:hypothetical protein